MLLREAKRILRKAGYRINESDSENSVKDRIKELLPGNPNDMYLGWYNFYEGADDDFLWGYQLERFAGVDYSIAESVGIYINDDRITVYFGDVDDPEISRNFSFSKVDEACRYAKALLNKAKRIVKDRYADEAEEDY